MREKLQNQYDKGIAKSGFKSRTVSKINELRELLDLPLRNINIEIESKHYDKDIVDVLWDIDFSELDGMVPGYHNGVKYAVLSVAGSGFIADTFEVSVSGDVVNEV